MLNRKDQKLTDCDMTWEEYTQAGHINSDYRQADIDLWVTCEYDFVNSLQVGDVLMLAHEDTGVLSPWVISVEIDDNDYVGDVKLLRVTRKIHSAMGLNVYVVETDDDYDLQY